MSSSERQKPRSDRYVCLIATLIAAAFIFFGSLFPFDLTRQDALNPGWLHHLRFTPWDTSDALVNIVVGVPLGFFLMGALLSGWVPSYLGAAIGALAVVGMSTLLATSVELLQLCSLTRQSSWNDVVAQGVGAALGAFGWIVAGPRVILWLRRLANRRESH